MGTQIENILTEIQSKCQSITQNIQNQIESINFPESRQKNEVGIPSSPSRPYYIVGGVVLVYSMIRHILGSSSLHTCSSLFASALCFGLGYKTQKEHEAHINKMRSQTIDFDAVRSECKHLANAVIDDANKEWNSFMEEQKIKVQRVIDQSSLSPEEKSEAKYRTYMYQELNLNTKSIIDSLNKLPNNDSFFMQAKNVMKQFSENCQKNVLRVANEQIDIYKDIKL